MLTPILCLLGILFMFLVPTIFVGIPALVTRQFKSKAAKIVVGVMIFMALILTFEGVKYAFKSNISDGTNGLVTWVICSIDPNNRDCRR